MRAWQFTGPHEPFVHNDVPVPSPHGTEVLIDVKAAGLCHSDVGILEDPKWLELMPVLPVTPGHEIAGVISAVGDEVTDFAVGDKVAVWPMGQTHGYAIDGGFGEKVIADAANVIPIPDGLAFDYAAASTDAGMTSHGAVRRGRVAAGEKVAIIGFGGLGQVAAQLIIAYGADLYIAEPREELWDFAEEIGATKVVKDITELQDVGLDVILDFAGFGDTTAAALQAVRYEGRVVLVGMGRLEATIDTYPLIIHRIDLLGSAGGSKEDISTVMDLMMERKVRLNLEHTTWDKIPDGVERLHQGDVKGRLVAIYE